MQALHPVHFSLSQTVCKKNHILFTQDKSSQLIFAQNLDDKRGNSQCEYHISTDNNPRVPDFQNINYQCS